MRRILLVSATLFVVAACESPTRPAPQPPPTSALPAPAPSPAPPRFIDIRGNYILTVEVGDGCEEVPQELRSRSYEATSSYAYPFESWDWFRVYLSAAKFYEGQQPVWMEVSENSVGLDLTDNVILEESSPRAYFAIAGYGRAPASATELSTISGSFSGWFRYCTATSGTGGSNQCSVAVMTRDMCRSENSRWTLTRR